MMIFSIVRVLPVAFIPEVHRAEYYGWKWCMHIGPFLIFLGRATNDPL